MEGLQEPPQAFILNYLIYPSYMHLVPVQQLLYEYLNT